MSVARRPRDFSEIIGEIVNWRKLPAVIQREPGVCWCGQRLAEHDHEIHEARWVARHAYRGETQ